MLVVDISVAVPCVDGPYNLLLERCLSVLQPSYMNAVGGSGGPGGTSNTYTHVAFFPPYEHVLGGR